MPLSRALYSGLFSAMGISTQPKTTRRSRPASLRALRPGPLHVLLICTAQAFRGLQLGSTSPRTTEPSHRGSHGHT